MKKLAFLVLFLGMIGLVRQNFCAEEGQRAAEPLTLQKVWDTTIAGLGRFLGMIGLVRQDFRAEEGQRAAKPLTSQEAWDTTNKALTLTDNLRQIVQHTQLTNDNRAVKQDLSDLDRDISALNNSLLTNLFTQLKESIKKPDTPYEQAQLIAQLKKQLRKFKNHVTSVAIRETYMGESLPAVLADLIAEFGEEEIKFSKKEVVERGRGYSYELPNPQTFRPGYGP